VIAACWKSSPKGPHGQVSLAWGFYFFTATESTADREYDKWVKDRSKEKKLYEADGIVLGHKLNQINQIFSSSAWKISCTTFNFKVGLPC
jgi:hypothetical protein